MNKSLSHMRWKCQYHIVFLQLVFWPNHQKFGIIMGNFYYIPKKRWLMIQICRNDREKVYEAIRTGKIDAAEMSFPNLIDDIILTMNGAT